MQVYALTHFGLKVLVSDSDCVQVFQLNGVFLRRWGSRGSGPGQFKSPWGVAVRGNEVWVSDTSNRLQVFRLVDGAFMYEVKIIRPTVLAVTPTNHVLVCNNNNICVFQ